MPLSLNSETRQLEVVQCRETYADAAVKWSLVGLVVLLAVGGVLSWLVPVYWEWKWRRKAKQEGLTK